MSLEDSRFKLAMFDKLTEQKKKCEKNIKELNFEIELLKKGGVDNLDYLEKLQTRKWNWSEKLSNTIVALDQLERDLNGGASLNPFLEKKKVES